MRTRISVLLPIILGVVTAAWAVISTDFNRQADFSRYHTYSRIGVRAGNTLWHDRIMGAVDGALAAKGWMKAPSSGDAGVSAFGRTREQDTLETFYDGFPGWGWRGWWGTGTATTVVEPQTIGDLTVDIFDGKTKQLIQRGKAEKTLSSKPEKNEKKLEKSVEDIFKKFPPPEKG